MRRKLLGSAGIRDLRTTQRSQIYFPVRSDYPALIAIYSRMPAHVYNTAHAAFVFNQNGGIIFYRQSMNCIPKLRSDANRLAKPVIEDIDAMARDIVQRPAS